MIITKTPLRISFFGGGSDIPEFYEKHNGLVLSMAINKHIYIAANQCVAPHFKVVYSKLELKDHVDDIEHDRVREALKHFNINSNVELCSFSDIPTKGTGLGSSSTFTVGLIQALCSEFYKNSVTPKQLAEMASYIEIELCKEPIGKQDQYAAAFGGMKSYEFTKDDVIVNYIGNNIYNIEEFERNLFCFNTGITRQASSVLTEQVDNLKKDLNVDYTKELVQMAKDGIRYYQKHQFNDFANLLHESWEIKKKLSSNVTNPKIDEMYERALKAGAIGGKILGAGGGGYLLVYAPPKYHNSLLNEMIEFERLSIKMDHDGCKVKDI